MVMTSTGEIFRTDEGRFSADSADYANQRPVPGQSCGPVDVKDLWVDGALPWPQAVDKQQAYLTQQVEERAKLPPAERRTLALEMNVYEIGLTSETADALDDAEYLTVASLVEDLGRLDALLLEVRNFGPVKVDEVFTVLVKFGFEIEPDRLAKIKTMADKMRKKSVGQEGSSSERRLRTGG